MALSVLATPRVFFALVFAASAAILGTALASQLVGGLEPCALCIYQRYPYAIAIGLSGVGFGLSGQARMPGIVFAALAGLCAAAFLANAGIAAYHVGVEQHWWAGTAACVGAEGPAASLDELRARILGAPVVPCDEVAWSLVGVSLAGYNFIASIALAGASGFAARRLGRRAGG